MKIQNSIKTIRKESHENWNHYKFESHNTCPFCNTGSLRMLGQVSDTQVFECKSCGKAFELNVITEEVIYDIGDNITEKIYQIDYEVDNGVDYIMDTAFVEASSPTIAKIKLKSFIHSLPGDLTISKFPYIGYVHEPTIITGKFGIK